MENIKRTCLYDKHIALNALMSPFAGFDMPIQYEGIVEEHQAVRNKCGVFDVSHMGEILITGEEAEKYVNYIFTNNVENAPVGKCFYGMMLNERGGVVDDLLVYKKNDDSYFLVVNASNISKDFDWIQKNSKDFKVNIVNLSDYYGEIAVQGPESESIIETVLGLNVKDLEFYTFKKIDFANEKIIVSRTGYTGEDGFEIYASHELINKFWDSLLQSGSVKPCGLGCRDTLRFEVGLPLYGDELTDDITPIEAGLGMFVKTEKDSFIGKETVVNQKNDGVKKKVVGLELKDKAIPRHGYNVLNPQGDIIGHITTGYRAISVDKSIAMALIDSTYAKMGTELMVQIRKKLFPAVVVGKKFYKKNYKQ